MASGFELSAPAALGRRQRWALLAGFVLLIVFRIPRAWKYGRFLDEEATVFLAYAWHHPWQDALFRPFAGYWNFAANASTTLVACLTKGGTLPLEYAPYLTMTAALAVQSLPAALVLTGRIPGLERRLAIVLALVFLAVAPGIEEVFFNVLHIQFHLALCVALILAMDPPRRAPTRTAYAAILFVAPLCGPAVLVFAPLFALRLAIDRDLGRLEQLALLAFGGAIQMLQFYGASPMRGHRLDPGTVAATMFLRLIAMPALGFGKTDRMGEAIYQSQIAGGAGWWWAAGFALVWFGALIALAMRRRDAAIWLLLSSVTMAVASFGFGMLIITRSDPFDLNSERYTFLPLVLLCLALIIMAMRSRSKARPALALILLLSLITGVSRYPRPLHRLSHGPAWAGEVAAWRLDHSRPLTVWPRQWKADLSDEARPCGPVSKDRARLGDPRYCESGWVASFFRHRRALRDPAQHPPW